MLNEIDDDTSHPESARPWWSELAESLAVWMGILIIGLSTAALATPTPAGVHPSPGSNSIGKLVASR